jgi:hypothetical protein
LPGLTKDDIEYYYNIFTGVREKNYLKRYGSALNEAHKAIAIKSLRDSADTA